MIGLSTLWAAVWLCSCSSLEVSCDGPFLVGYNATNVKVDPASLCPEYPDFQISDPNKIEDFPGF